MMDSLDAKPSLPARSGRLFTIRAAISFVLSIVLTATITLAAIPASAANIVTIQQASTGRFVDAHEIETLDWHLVTRAAQNNDTQLWRMVNLGNNIFTFQQMSNNRFMDAQPLKRRTGESSLALLRTTRPSVAGSQSWWRSLHNTAGLDRPICRCLSRC